MAPTGPEDEHTFSFYVMGDIAYKKSEKDLLIEQLKEIKSEEAAAANVTIADDVTGNPRDPDDGESLFTVHVGDIFTTAKWWSADCPYSEYKAIKDIFVDHSHVPTFVLPGDNDWIDCPNSTIAWDRWADNFIPFEQHSAWDDVNFVPQLVRRQAIRPENFAFHFRSVLFMGLNLIAGTRGVTESEAVWDERIGHCQDWAATNINDYIRQYGGPPRTIIFFGHARRGREVWFTMQDLLYQYQIPVVYLHGNGHEFYVDNPIVEWPRFTEVQVDQGANARPVKVTVRGTTQQALNRPFVREDINQHIFGGLVKLDRRGGLYPDANINPKDDADGLRRWE